MNRLYEVKLTLRELLLLEGNCSDEVDIVVKQALADNRISNSIDDAPEPVKLFVCDAVREAVTNGELIFRYKRIRRGKYSGVDAGYERRSRSSRYGRKGETNYDKPLTVEGVELAYRFVTIQNQAVLGDTVQFFDDAKPYLAIALEGIEAEIPEEITGHKPLFKKHIERKCESCGWVGLEYEMGKSMYLTGDGYYPSTCPSCKAQGSLFSDKVKPTGRWKVLPVGKAS